MRSWWTRFWCEKYWTLSSRPNWSSTARTVSVAAVIDGFRKEDPAGTPVAVIVSELGLPTQKPLGVVVRDDLAYLLEQLPAAGA